MSRKERNLRFAERQEAAGVPRQDIKNLAEIEQVLGAGSIKYQMKRNGLRAVFRRLSNERIARGRG